MKIADLIIGFLRMEERYGPAVAAAFARFIMKHTTIEYTPEQDASFFENEVAAREYREDDLRRAGL